MFLDVSIMEVQWWINETKYSTLVISKQRERFLHYFKVKTLFLWNNSFVIIDYCIYLFIMSSHQTVSESGSSTLFADDKEGLCYWH
jgi:hypothetical protein